MMRIFIIGNDDRMKWLAKLLAVHFHIYYHYSSCWDTKQNELLVVHQPDFVILPPVELELKVTHIPWPTNVQLFSGQLSEKWQALIKEQTVHDYSQDEYFLWENARLTAYSLLSYFFTNQITPQSERLLVAGFGRVGKMTAHLLRQIGANVTIASHNERELAEAKAFRYDTVSLHPQHTNCSVLINTIPAKWFTAEHSQLVNCPIYDLASSPGCLADIQVPSYERLGALPASYFPYEAAELLQQVIIKCLKGEESCSKEDESD